MADALAGERATRRIGPAAAAEAARGRRLLVRGARLLVLAIVIGIPLSQVIIQAARPWMMDFTSYWWAGQAWSDTGSPYTLHPHIVGDNPIYRYAPWFAVPWVALVHLPQQAVEIGWFALNAVASVVAVIPVLRQHGSRAIPLAIFMGGILLVMAMNGNVQPLLIAGLTWGLGTRWGPLAIAVTASLKVVPILFVIPYVAQRQWSKVAWTLGLTALLGLPTFLFDYPARTLDPGSTLSFWAVSPVVWVVVVAAFSLAALYVSARWPRYGNLAAAAAAFEALPRLFLYDVTFLLPGASRVPLHGDENLGDRNQRVIHLPVPLRRR